MREPAAELASEMAFLGPFEGHGISGHNDLDNRVGTTSQECAELCAAHAHCQSFDYGARGMVSGECWLSTANRGTAGHAYTGHWHLYDYYEKPPHAAAPPTPTLSDGRMEPAAAAGRPMATAAAATREAGGGGGGVAAAEASRGDRRAGDSAALKDWHVVAILVVVLVVVVVSVQKVQ